MKFLQIKEGGPNFWEEPILQNVWIIWSRLLYFNFKSFLDPNSLPLLHFVWFRSTSLKVFKFVQIKEAGCNFCREPLSQNVWTIWSPLLYFNLKSSIDPNSSSFIRFQSILLESGRLFSESWNFYKLNKGELIYRGNQFCSMSQLFGPPFCASILRVF